MPSQREANGSTLSDRRREYHNEDPDAIVHSGGARWLRNIKVSPEPKITIGSQKFVAVYRWLGVEGAATVIRRYEQCNRLAIPIVRLVLSRFLGWQCHSTYCDRRGLTANFRSLHFLAKDDAIPYTR